MDLKRKPIFDIFLSYKSENGEWVNKLKDSLAKIKQNKQLPWLVSNIVEILDMPTELNDDGTIDTE